MMIMCGQSNQIWHYWAGRHPGKVGHLFGPRNFTKQTARKWMPFACDNDAFTAWTSKQPWDEAAWFNMLNRVGMIGLDPLWILLPDVVADREQTLANWDRYKPHVQRRGWKMAFAVQDGMTPKDVPSDADVIFVGGTDAFKWRSIAEWTANFPRVHVGRVNTVERLAYCESVGAESCDGTGWFKDPSRFDKLQALERWIEGEHQPHPTLSL